MSSNEILLLGIRPPMLSLLLITVRDLLGVSAQIRSGKSGGGIREKG